MRVTDVRIKGKPHGDFKAYASVTFDDKFVVTGLKIVHHRAGNRLMVAMPSRKREDGTWADVAHPITSDFREEIERVVLEAYHAWPGRQALAPA